MRKVIVIGVGAAVVVAGLFFFSFTQVSTDSDQTALHYKGGPLSSKKFSDCIPPSTREIDGPADSHYVYPTSQRTFDATGGRGAEADPFTVVSKDNAEMRVPVTVTFTLNSDCDSLRTFHERLGNRYAAYFDGNEASDGWGTLLNFAIGKPLDTSLDRVAQAHNWRDLWNNPATKTAVEKQVDSTLSDLVRRQTGGDYFTDFEILIQKPDPVNAALKENVAAEQASVAKANAARAEAEAQKIAAEAQIAVQRAEAEKIRQRVAVIGVDGWLKEKAIEKGITPYPAPVAYPVPQVPQVQK